MRRLLGLLGILVLLAALVLAGILGIGLLAGDEASDDDDIAKPELGEATIVRTDLVERDSFDGVLQFVGETLVTGQITGTVTGVPVETASLARGDTAVEVDGVPVIVFYGTRPSWRLLADGVDDGADVLQLESNLAALGYDDAAELEAFEPDRTFDADTAAMVERWREDVGLPGGEAVELGRVLYLDGAVRVGEILVLEGQIVAPGTPLFMASGTTKEVVVPLPVDRRDLATVGDTVVVELPDDRTTTGTISDVSNLVRTIGSGADPQRVVDVTIDLADPSVAGDLDQAPVTIELESNRVSGALAVPVNALVALAEGGYALQVVENGERRYVGVEIGTFVDSLVEVTGDIQEGQTILVPQ